jgi:hypothetical protein
MLNESTATKLSNGAHMYKSAFANSLLADENCPHPLKGLWQESLGYKHSL